MGFAASAFLTASVEPCGSPVYRRTPANAAWAEYRTAQGSTSGHWTFFPAYGGGGEDYDYKAVGSYGSHAEHGTDWDNFDPAKGREIFGGVSDCDSARVYNATNIRMAESDDE